MPRDRERGSVLLLVPAGMLVLLILGAIAVDSAVVLLGQRELGSAVSAAANDAAAAAFADAPFYEGGAVQLDLSRAQQVAQQSFAARRPGGLELTRPLDVTIAGRQICVSAEATVRHVFSPSVPGLSRVTTVRAQSGATLAGASGITRSSACS